MRLRPEQLAPQLAKGLAPVYFISGEEPLLMQEACDAVRKACADAHISERERINIDKSDHWQQLLAAGANMSLFGERKLIEIHLPNGKPGREGSSALQDYIQTGSEDVLLVISGKVDKASTNSKWYKALDQAGVVMQVWPVNSQQLPQWLRQRCQAKGLDITPEALALLSHQVEGNLLAAAQEIEKLHLLCDGNTIDATTVSASVGSSARYDLFGMVDAALQGRTADALRMLNGLRGEGTEATVVLWALAREQQLLHQIHDAQTRGQALPGLFKQLRIWDSKARLLTQTLSRHNKTSLTKLTRLASEADGSIKGFGDGKPWDNLAGLVVCLSGSV